MTLSSRFVVIAIAAVFISACSDQNPAAVSADGTVPNAYTAPAEPVNGEFIRQSGTSPVYLVYNRTLYGVPDMQTLRACTGGYDKVVRVVSSVPAWPVRALPSAGNPQTRPHGRAWVHGDKPIQSTAGGAVYLLVGCVRAGIPSEAVYQQTFGDTDWTRVVKVSDADLKAFPEGPLAQGHPLRRAGTLLHSGWVKWVTFHGGSLGVPNPETMDSYCRPWTDLVNNAAEHGWYVENGIVQPGSGPGTGCLRGDDYPYRSQSYGTYRPAYDADPWNFWYRECTSFVAWRLNQDGIEFHNAYGVSRWGHAHEWDEAARYLQTYQPKLGVTINNTPKRGAVAQWNSTHVAYVAAVLNGDSVLIEEYNYSRDGTYKAVPRRLPSSAVENYIHFR